MAGFTVTGAAKMQQTLRRIANLTPLKVERALYQEAQVEMTEAKKRTPVDTGTLRASGHVGEPERDGRRVSVEMSFGGPAAPYAIFVHENLEANHDSPPYGGGQAKFLESVILESAPHLSERVAARIDLEKK